LTETFDEVKNEINEMFKKANETDDISLIHENIWPAVVRLEEFFRKTDDIRALEDQVALLFQMGDNIYRGAYLRDAYVVCRRILDLDPTKEEAKHSIEEHVIPYFHQSESIEPELDSYFMKCKKDEFVLFLDDNANNFNSQGNDVGQV